MAVIATIFGAIIYSAAFTGASYIGKAIDGTDEARKNEDEETKRHDLALEKYNNDYNIWEKQMQAEELWKEEQERQKSYASHKFKNTDDAFSFYAQAHPDKILIREEPHFNNYYTPSPKQRNREVIFTGLAVVGLTYFISKYI